MIILDFTEQFPTESSCRTDFKLQREKEGVFCKQFRSSTHYWSKGKSQWECKSCKFRTGLESGSMMENSNLPARTWYLAILFMSFKKKGISAKDLQCQLKHNKYNLVVNAQNS